MKLLPVLLCAFVPALASAETHVLCRTSHAAGYKFSFDETGLSKEGVTFKAPLGKTQIGSPVFKYGPNLFSFSLDEMSVRFDSRSWQAEFETPGYPDMEPPTVRAYQCEPDPAYHSGGDGI